MPLRGGGPRRPRHVVVRHQEHNLCVIGRTIGHLKVEILERTGIPVRGQKLLYKGKLLLDGKHRTCYHSVTAAQCARHWLSLGFRVASTEQFTDRREDEQTRPYHGKEVKLIAKEERSVNTLSVGAGGSIDQHIERDQNDPRIWDLGNSKILNVQLVDSRTFRLVTGLEPPETPIKPETYRAMGLPFYRLSREPGKGDGVAGLWNKVVGTKKVASQIMKLQTKVPHLVTLSRGSTSGTENWLASGTSSSSETDASGQSAEGLGTFRDTSFDFPVVLLDVDHTVPHFKSVVGAEEDADGMYM
jgi:hypothetical protein